MFPNKFVTLDSKFVMPREKGARFIAIEGLDGSGSSTQVKLLFEYFRKKKKKVHFTREPTRYLIGGLIKSYVSGDWKSTPECLQLLFTADRAYHLNKEIIPLLKKGVIVICDRYFFSTLAYGSLEIKDKEWLFNLNKKFILPDITFLLKVRPKICLKRMRKERFFLTLFEEEEKLKKVWKNFEKLAKEFKNIYVINGERPVEKITNEIIEIVTEKFG